MTLQQPVTHIEIGGKRVKVFWSWQSDVPGKVGRHFIREALNKAIEELKVEGEIDEREEETPLSALHLDHDRKGVPGSPDLARTILDKISEASVFVADVTAIGKVNVGPSSSSEKRLINSNVAIELGYALGKIGDASLLMVMNEHYGSRDNLPFDLKAKAGPMLFRLAADATNQEIAIVQRSLVSQLKSSLSLCITKKIAELKLATPFQVAVEKDGPGRFRAADEPIGVRGEDAPFRTETEAPVYLADGPIMWLRLMPSSSVGRTWTTRELRAKATNGSFDLCPIAHGQGILALRADDGFGICPFLLAGVQKVTSAAFVFESGEIWSVDTEYLSYDKRIPYLEEILTSRLQSYAKFLSALGIKPPFRWYAGMDGVKNFRLDVPTAQGYYRPGLGPLCLKNTIVADGYFDGTESPYKALSRFFSEIFDRCDTQRPSHLPQ